MNIFDIQEDALLEASRIQREEAARLGFTLADLYPEEVASLRHFLEAQGLYGASQDDENCEIR